MRLRRVPNSGRRALESKHFFHRFTAHPEASYAADPACLTEPIRRATACCADRGQHFAWADLSQPRRRFSTGGQLVGGCAPRNSSAPPRAGLQLWFEQHSRTLQRGALHLGRLRVPFDCCSHRHLHLLMSAHYRVAGCCPAGIVSRHRDFPSPAQAQPTHFLELHVQPRPTLIV